MPKGTARHGPAPLQWWEQCTLIGALPAVIIALTVRLTVPGQGPVSSVMVTYTAMVTAVVLLRAARSAWARQSAAQWLIPLAAGSAGAAAIAAFFGAAPWWAAPAGVFGVLSPYVVWLIAAVWKSRRAGDPPQAP